MNTIHATLTWEYLARNRWAFPLPFLLAVATALLVLLPLKSLDFSPNARELVGLQLVLLWALIFIVILGVFESQGSLKSLYSKPISTTGLVGYFFWSGALLVAIQIALLILLCRSLLGIPWPFAGPILFAVVFWGWTQLLFRVSMRTFWWVPAALVIFAALLSWSMYRHGVAFKEGGMIDPSVHYWATLTGLDVVIVIASLLATFSLTTWRVTCDRSGRPAWLGLGLGLARKRWEAKPDRAATIKTFSSGQRAHEWFDFQNRNASLSLVVLAELILVWLIALAIYPLFGDASVSLRTALVGTFLVVITEFVAAISLTLSAMKGHSAQNYQAVGKERSHSKPIPFGMSQFIKALPISSRQMATAMLCSSARAVGISALFIFASFVLLGGLSWLLGLNLVLNDSKFNYWRQAFATTACSMLLSYIILNLTCLYSPRKVSWEHWIAPPVVLLSMLTLWSPAFPFVSYGAAVIALSGLGFATAKSIKRGDISWSNALLLWLAGAVTSIGLILCLPTDSRLMGSVLIATLVMLALLPFFSTAAALRILRTN